MAAFNESTVIVGTLCVSVFLVGVAGAEIARRKGLKAGLGAPMGTPDWDFGKSWATNVAVFGAILGAFIQTKDVFKTSNEFLLAALFFALLVVVAPLVFLVIRWGEVGGRETDRRGYVGAFLVSCALTGWASLGQLGLLHLASSSVASGSMAVTWLGALIDAAFVLLALHINRSTVWTAISQSGKKQVPAKAPIAEVESGQPARWPLL